MTKADFVAALAEKMKSSKKDAESCVEAFCELISETLGKGDEVRLLGFGSFSVQNRKATMARNPKTGAPVEVKATSVPKFKPGAVLKEAVKNSR